MIARPVAAQRVLKSLEEPFLISGSVIGILAQRLVRKICEKCKESVELPESQVKQLQLTPEQAASATFFQGKGCAECNGSGYRGRVPIFEFLVMDSELREAIAAGAREAQIRTMIREKGYGGLLSSGVTRILDGRTTVEEILRVTYADNIAQ